MILNDSLIYRPKYSLAKLSMYLLIRIKVIWWGRMPQYHYQQEGLLNCQTPTTSSRLRVGLGKQSQLPVKDWSGGLTIMLQYASYPFLQILYHEG